MAERSFFFNSAPGDPRTYQASDFAQYFGNVLSSGLLHTDNIPALEVKCEGNDLRTYVTPGKAIIQGYAYENTENLYLQHALPEPTLDRIDRIVLRLDKRHQSRFIRLFVKQGEPSDNPVPPSLQRDDFIYELSLARILVRANTSTLNPADLVDERLDEDLCGLVNSLLTVPTSQFQAQWDAFFNDKQDEVNQAVDDYLQALLDAEQALQDDIDAFEQQWNDWFSQQQTEGFVLQSEKGQPGGVAKQDDFAAHQAEIATLVQYGHVQHGIITATVLAEDWEGDEAPYTNTVSTPSVLATDNPIVDVIDIDGSVQDAWGTIFRVVTSDGLIIFYALEKPDVDLQVQIKVVR